MSKKVYEYILAPKVAAIFYVRDGKLTHVDDANHPMIHGSCHIWTPENGYVRAKSQYTENTRVTTPLTQMNKKHFNQFIRESLASMNKAYEDLSGNLIVVKRVLDSENIETGIMLYDAITDTEIN